MQWPPSSLYPLIDYLESRHGEFDVFEDWAPELLKTVTHYLVNELSDTEFVVFLEKLEEDVPGDSREDRVDFVIEHNQLWDVQWADHMVVLDAAPDLASLISFMKPRHIDYESIGDWIRRNAPYQYCAELFHQFDPDETPPVEDSDWWTFEYEDWLRTHVRSHKKLLQAWEVITRPRSSTTPATHDTRAIREWARGQGRQVGSRGRISDALIREYRAATAPLLKSEPLLK